MILFVSYYQALLMSICSWKVLLVTKNWKVLPVFVDFFSFIDLRFLSFFGVIQGRKHECSSFFVMVAN